MAGVAVSAARAHLARLIDTTRRTGEPVYVTRRGQPVAVSSTPRPYERLDDRLVVQVTRIANRTGEHSGA